MKCCFLSKPFVSRQNVISSTLVFCSKCMWKSDFPYNVVILAYSKHFWFCSQFEDFNPDSMDDRMIITNRESRVQIESLIDFQIFFFSQYASKGIEPTEVTS